MLCGGIFLTGDIGTERECTAPSTALPFYGFKTEKQAVNLYTKKDTEFVNQDDVDTDVDSSGEEDNTDAISPSEEDKKTTKNPLGDRVEVPDTQKPGSPPEEGSQNPSKQQETSRGTDD